MKRFKSFLMESPSYKEIEFVCHNTEHLDSTPRQSQLNLHSDLKRIDGVIPLHQDWSELSPQGHQQHSLSAIYTTKKQEKSILSAAKKHGVSVDITRDVSDEYADDAKNGKHDYQVS